MIIGGIISRSVTDAPHVHNPFTDVVADAVTLGENVDLLDTPRDAMLNTD